MAEPRGSIRMRTLVTGAAGFVGAHLIRHLRSKGHDVHAMTLPGEVLAADLRGVQTHHADVTDAAALERLLREVTPEWVFHLAAISRPEDCRKNPSLAWNVNFLGTHNLYRLGAEAVPGARVLFVGSATEYGHPAAEDLPLTEDAPLRPGDVYAATKLAGDLAGAEFALRGKLAVLRVRPFNHIGPGQEVGFVAPDFARQLARIELGLQEPKLRVGNLASARDFTDVRDVVRAYVLVMERGEPGAVYNVCSGTAHAVRELLAGLLALSTVKPEVVATTCGKTDKPDVVVGSAEALHAATGWKPEIPWEQTLVDLLNDWRERVARENPA
jgi:GDP-4-dehydro-6-deoxy-D-mannose reductase